MATAAFKTITEVPINSDSWECPNCHNFSIPLALVDVSGSTGEAIHPGNNQLKAKTVDLNLKSKVVGVYMPGHVCLDIPSQDAALALGHMDRNSGQVITPA